MSISAGEGNRKIALATLLSLGAIFRDALY
jgi:hypothetical protein